MNYSALRKELREYYSDTSYKNANRYLAEGRRILDAHVNETMSPYEMKVLQYKTITEMFEPILFENSPFYYETGILPGFSDGARNFHGHEQIGGWTYGKNSYKFEAYDKAMWSLSMRQRSELLYLICGAYNDDSQHFMINHRVIFEKGLQGVYKAAREALTDAVDSEEKQFLSAVCDGLLCVKKASEKFADKAEELLKIRPDDTDLKRISISARRCPWEKPASFYEALNTYAFMRKIIGSLEGIGPNTFGRADVDLLPFYEADIKSGIMNEDEAFGLISRFLITFDCHYDHDAIMAGYADHELENTYVLGGCDADGNPIFNKLTEMFLTATREEKIIFPKIKCRFSAQSPKAYLDLINKPILHGTSTVLYQNDDASIPALIRSGLSERDARDYVITGCWDMIANGCSAKSGGNYVNLLKAFEFQLHDSAHAAQRVGIPFEGIDDAESFEEVYKITCENMNRLFTERSRIAARGGHIWHEVDPLPIFSSLYGDCLQNRRDITDNGSRYKNESYLCVGFPNIVDSLMAIKTLCFDEKKVSLRELLRAVRQNWEGFDELRGEAMRCHGWGDGNDDSCRLAKRFNTDLYTMLSALKSQCGGKINLGHLTYTEIRFWAKKTLATPDGRRNGEYFAQGLTPSRLKKIPCVTDVVGSLAALDKTELGGNTVVNIILPESTTPEICKAFLRATAHSAIESLQLNCVSKKRCWMHKSIPKTIPI